MFYWFLFTEHLIRVLLGAWQFACESNNKRLYGIVHFVSLSFPGFFVWLNDWFSDIVALAPISRGGDSQPHFS